MTCYCALTVVSFSILGAVVVGPIRIQSLFKLVSLGPSLLNRAIYIFYSSLNTSLRAAVGKCVVNSFTDDSETIKSSGYNQ